MTFAPLARPLAYTTLIFLGAIFGFFYAWICSTIWGLDRLEPTTAIAAMQAMNASVRNAVFAPTFFGTTPLAFLAAWAAHRARAALSARWLMLAGLTYGFGAMMLTMMVNVPMNEVLAIVELPNAEADQIWQDYARTWEFWNIIRTLASGAALLMCGMALYRWPGRA